MEKRIIIFYLHRRFITELLHSLFPAQFQEEESLPDCNLELVLTQGEETVKVYSYFGFNQELLSRNFDEIYLDSSLMTEQIAKEIEKLPCSKDIKITSMKELKRRH